MIGKRAGVWVMSAGLCALALGAHAAAPTPPLPLQRLNGGAAAAANPGVVLFWRADCGPCLLELGDLAALRRAARPLTVTPVGLQPTATLRPALARLRLGDGDSLLTTADPAAVLTRYGGAPPRLPLAVALSADGSVCARHTGLLGRDLVRRWGATCGGGHAAR